MEVIKERVEDAINGNREALSFAFVWDETPQGHYYWSEQYNGFAPIDVEALKAMIAEEDTPKLWRDMTDAEKGALLLAHHEGKKIENNATDDGRFVAATPVWAEEVAYRIKPEPVRETFTHEQWVSMHGGSNRGAFSLLYGPAHPGDDVKGQTTIEMVDGKPVRVVWEPVK